MQYTRSSVTGVAIFGFVFTALLGIYSAHTWHRESQSTDWTETTGTILESHVETQDGIKGRTHPDASVTYEYAVDGRIHRSDRVRWGAPDDTPKELVRAYPKGAQVSVYYDPKAPERAVLRQGATRDTTVWGPLLVGFFLIGSIYLWNARDQMD